MTEDVMVNFATLLIPIDCKKTIHGGSSSVIAILIFECLARVLSLRQARIMLYRQKQNLLLSCKLHWKEHRVSVMVMERSEGNAEAGGGSKCKNKRTIAKHNQYNVKVSKCSLLHFRGICIHSLRNSWRNRLCSLSTFEIAMFVSDNIRSRVDSSVIRRKEKNIHKNENTVSYVTKI